jgi:hypothetical protein
MVVAKVAERGNYVEFGGAVAETDQVSRDF